MSVLMGTMIVPLVRVLASNTRVVCRLLLVILLSVLSSSQAWNSGTNITQRGEFAHWVVPGNMIGKNPLSALIIFYLFSPSVWYISTLIYVTSPTTFDVVCPSEKMISCQHLGGNLGISISTWVGITIL
jgi:hypothetical protein